MTIFLCLICFSIYDKMQGFIDESGLFIFLFIFFFFFGVLHRNSRWPPKSGGENNFCKKSPVDSADTMRVKNFVEIAPSCSISEINVFLCLTQKFKMATKSGGKTFFCKIMPVDSADSLRVKHFVEIALSHSFQDKHAF